MAKQSTLPVSACIPVSAPRDDNARLMQRLLMARHNLLSVWSSKDYRAKNIGFKVFRRQYHVCNSAESVRQAFLEQHDNYDRKSPQMRHALEPLLGDGLFVSDGELWKQRRAFCAPAFDAELLPNYASVMSDTAVRLADDWATLSPEKPVDMLNEMARLTARIIGRALFGDSTPEEEASQVVEGFSEYQRYAEQLEFADTIGMPLLKYLNNPWRRHKIRRSADKVHQVLERIMARHRATDAKHGTDLLSLLLACPMDSEAVRNEAIVMFMAGHETTANSLAWSWYLLDHCPHAMDKLHQELDSVLQGREPTLQDVDKLPYTQAVFEEAMRLYPPVPILSREARQAGRIGDREIRAGSVILVVPWLLHRHEAYWDQPEAFIPERFLPGQPKPDKFVYLPFSVGPRVCLGKRFGLTEGILCLATLAQKFRPRLTPGHTVDIECRLTLRPKGGLPMLLERR